MEFWINRKSESDNVIILSEGRILITSCDEAHYDEVESKLNKSDPFEVFERDDFTIIPFLKIQKIESRSTDDSVDVIRLVKKEHEESTLHFDSVEQKAEFVEALKLKEISDLTVSVRQQSALVAAFYPLISLALGLFISYLFFDRLRWTTILIGTIWLGTSLYMLYFRFTKPPVITAWVKKGRIFRKLSNMIKTVFASIIALVIVASLSRQFPISYGPKAILSHLKMEELEPEDVATLVSRGADVNYEDPEWDYPLAITVYNEDAALTKALLDAGAKIIYENESESRILTSALEYSDKISLLLLQSDQPLGKLESNLAYAIRHGRSLKVIDSLVKRGANSKEVDDDGNNLLVTVIEYDDNDDLFSYFLEQGLSTDVKVQDKTLLDFAKNLERTKIVKLIEQQGK